MTQATPPWAPTPSAEQCEANVWVDDGDGSPALACKLEQLGGGGGGRALISPDGGSCFDVLVWPDASGTKFADGCDAGDAGGHESFHFCGLGYFVHDERLRRIIESGMMPP